MSTPSEESPLAGPPTSPSPAVGAAPEADLENALRSVGRNTTILFATTIIFFLFNFISRVAAARGLGPYGWGEFTLATSVTGLLSLVGLLGMNQATAQTIAYEKDPGARRAIIRWSLGVTLAAAVSLSIAIFFSAGAIALFYHNPGLIGAFQLLSITVGFAMLSSTLTSVFRGFQDARPAALFNQIINPGLFVAFVLLFLEFGFALVGVLVAYLLAAGLSFAALAVYSFVRLPRLIPRNVVVPRRPTPRLWQLTVALWGVMNLAYITTFADTIILGIFRPADVVGQYSVAITLARLLIIGTTAVTFAYMPVTASFARDDSFDHARVAYQAGARWMLFLTLPFFLLFAFAPNLSIDAIFGGKYLPAAASLQVLVVSSFVATLFGPVNASLVGFGQYRSQLSTSLVSALSNVGLSFALIPTFGSAGAATAWGVAKALYPGLGLAILYRRYRISPFGANFLRPLLVTLVIGAPVVWVVGQLNPPHWTVVPLFGFGLVLLVGVSLLTRSVTKEDLLALESLERYLGRAVPVLRRLLTRFIARPPGDTSRPQTKS